MEDHDLIGKATSASEENTTNEVYRKVTFEVVFSTALVDSYLIYKENYPASKAAILQFRESLVRSLLLGIPFYKPQSVPRLKKRAGRIRRKRADHEFEEKRGSARDV